VYFSILYARCRSGVVTRDMLALPKHRFVAIGLLEALGVASGMSAGGSFGHAHSENGVIDFYRLNWISCSITKEGTKWFGFMQFYVLIQIR